MNPAKLVVFLSIIVSFNSAMAMKREHPFEEGYTMRKQARIDETQFSPINFVQLHGLNTVELRQGKKGSQCYEINEAYDVFINRSQPSPITRLPLSHSQIDRVKLYKKYYERFGECEVLSTDVETLFIKHLKSKGLGLSDDERLKLDRWLTFDSSDSVFSNLGTKLSDMSHDHRIKFKDLAAKALRFSEVGSWIFRPSSIEDNLDDEIFIRTISSKVDNSTVSHFRLLHVSKYGFCIEVNERMNIVSLDDFNVEDHKMKCFASLTELMQFASKESLNFDLSKYVRVAKSGYQSADDI